MRYVFGPVPSRRLGQSLGIDPVPSKTCNWNCVYCQLGYTAPLVGRRQDFIPAAEIVREVHEALQAHASGEIDWVTFVGSGETALHASLGVMIREVKRITELPVAVITNGSLLHLSAVREELSAADAVLPSLDAGTERLYLRINRPKPEFSFARLVRGLVAFRKMHHGRLWIEVMLVKGLNDTERALDDLATVLRRIDPDEVHLNVPTRPPCESWVRAPDADGLRRAHAILGDVARIVRPVEGSFDLSGCDDAVEAILQVIVRHPMSEEDVARSLAQWSRQEVSDALARLASSGRAQLITRSGKRFWCSSHGKYLDRPRQEVDPRAGGEAPP